MSQSLKLYLVAIKRLPPFHHIDEFLYIVAEDLMSAHRLAIGSSEDIEVLNIQFLAGLNMDRNLTRLILSD